MRRLRIGDFAGAIKRGEIIPHFQPLVELRERRPIGFEVLARWNHPQRGLVSPDVFIGFAEKAGLIGQLSEALLERAGRFALSWPEGLRMSLNISPRQLQDLALADRLAAIAQRTGFPLSRLTIEITESALMEQLDLARRLIDALRGAGARFALDNFGTSYASLSLLHALPFDSLKIDASFVGTMAHRRESREIVAASVGFARRLGIGTVAEGVETEEQAAMLLRLGCNLGQGCLFGPPAAEAVIPSRIAAPPLTVGEEVMLGLKAPPGQHLARLQALYDAAPVGLAFVDCDLRYVSLNRCLAEMHLLPVAMHIGRMVTEILPDLFEQIAPLLQRALTGEPVTECVVRDAAPDGSSPRRIYRVSYCPARDFAGKIVGISVAVIDLSWALSA